MELLKLRLKAAVGFFSSFGLTLAAFGFPSGPFSAYFKQKHKTTLILSIAFWCPVLMLLPPFAFLAGERFSGISARAEHIPWSHVSFIAATRWNAREARKYMQHIPHISCIVCLRVEFHCCFQLKSDIQYCFTSRTLVVVVNSACNATNHFLSFNIRHNFLDVQAQLHIQRN